MDLMQFLTVYKDFGVAGLFIALYLVTVWAFYKDMKATRADDLKVIERVVDATDRSTAALSLLTKAFEAQQRAIEENTTKMDEYLAYMRGRDGVLK